MDFGVNNNNLRNATRSSATSRADAKKPGTNIDAVYEDESKNAVSIESFLQLMIQQLKNQDFMNPTDDGQYLTQMAQFATMQQMEELAYFSRSNYAMSLAGKDVTVAKLGIGGKVEKITGPVEKIAYIDKDYKVYVKGQAFNLGQIMEINGVSTNNSTVKPNDTSKVDFSKIPVSINNRTENTIDVSWDIASETQGLKFSVYYSKNSQFDTIEDVKKGILVGEAERESLKSEKISGLDPETTYFINVIVKDKDGKEHILSKGITTTLKKP